MVQNKELEFHEKVIKFDKTITQVQHPTKYIAQHSNILNRTQEKSHSTQLDLITNGTRQPLAP